MWNKCKSGNQVTSGTVGLSNQANVTRPEIWTRTGPEAGCGCWCGESPEVWVLGRVERVINECYLEGSALGRTLCFPLITLAGRKREGGSWGIGGIPSSKPGISLAFLHSASCFTCLWVDMMTYWGGGLGELFEWVIFMFCPDFLMVPYLKENMKVIWVDVGHLADFGNLFFSWSK